MRASGSTLFLGFSGEKVLAFLPLAELGASVAALARSAGASPVAQATWFQFAA